MQNWKIWTTNTFRGYRDYPLNVFFSFYIRSHYLCAQFKQKQRKVKMREMNCKWLRMSNIS